MNRITNRVGLFGRIVALGLTLLIVVTAAGTAAARLTDYIFPADPGNPTAVRGCVIRFDQLSESGASVVPRVHANEAHTCIGVTSVAVDWTPGGAYGDLIVNNTGGSNNVVWVTAEEDENLAQRDIQCGPSGGGTLTRIRCYRDGVKIPAQSLEMYGPNVNLWLSWEMWMP